MSRIEKALEKAAEKREKQEAGQSPSRIAKTLEKAAGLQQRDEPLAGGGETVQGKSEETVRRVPETPVHNLQIDHPLIFTYSDPRSPIAEEFRKLKSAIVNLIRQGDPRKVLMITSSLSGEGKSVSAINLAITLAQEFDHTVLLVDADLRKPSIHKYFHFTPRIGLADCLSDGTDISAAMVRTSIGRLSFIPAGREVENPAELLGAQRMKSLVHELKHRYHDRFVIIDTPPVLPVAETRTLSSYVDGVIFVVKECGVSLQNVQDALEAIPRKKVLGIVYNNVRSESLSGRYHYYYHGY